MCIPAHTIHPISGRHSRLSRFSASALRFQVNTQTGSLLVVWSEHTSVQCLVMHSESVSQASAGRSHGHLAAIRVLDDTKLNAAQLALRPVSRRPPGVERPMRGAIHIATCPCSMKSGSVAPPEDRGRTDDRGTEGNVGNGWALRTVSLGRCEWTDTSPGPSRQGLLGSRPRPNVGAIQKSKCAYMSPLVAAKRERALGGRRQRRCVFLAALGWHEEAPVGL